MKASTRSRGTKRGAGLAARLALACLVGGCGNSALRGDDVDDDATPDGGLHDGDATDPGPDAAVPPMSPWTELTAPAVSVAGGAAMTAGGVGAAGGAVHLISQGGITFDAGRALSPSIPAPPADATHPTMLTTNVDAPGALVIDGSLMSAGAEPVRTFHAHGDIFVTGSLRAVAQGAARQGFRLTADGNIYVSGVIDTSGLDGQAAGEIELDAANAVVVTGTLDAAGGDARGDGDVTGGAGGKVTVQAGGDVTLAGTVRVRGGAGLSAIAGATGGAAGDTVIDGNLSAAGAITIGGVLDGRGGLARSGSPTAITTGGAAGALRIGEHYLAPTQIDIDAILDDDGGTGGATGGAGGTLELAPRTGDLVFAGRVSASGGASAQHPGAGGLVRGHPGPDTATATHAGVVIAGELAARGGSVVGQATADGGAGGEIELIVQSTDGTMTEASSGTVDVGGGHAAGDGRGGDAGRAFLFTRDGNASIGGHLSARGGDATGGTGGTGGLLYVFTDDNHGGPGPGVLVIETTGVIDSSGGAGAIGGSSRNDGNVNAVASWPTDQTDERTVEQIAVLINSDGVHGGATGWIDNRGMIIARGGHTNGSGGDVFFHGTGPDRLGTPTPGMIDDAGDGTGAPGTFGGKHIIIVGPTF